MPTINFKQGEDLIVQIPVYDTNFQLVDISNADKVRVAFIIKDGVAKKFLDYTLEPNISGYGVCYANNLDPTIVDVYVTREISRDLPVGQLSARILVEFPDTLLNNIAVEYVAEVGSVLQGYLKDEDLSL